uniref:Uncharacterized protein n=1 Tax=Megaselia scalaris TaxID=36166 RepID=T1GN03_MEGSC
MKASNSPTSNMIKSSQMLEYGFKKTKRLRWEIIWRGWMNLLLLKKHVSPNAMVGPIRERHQIEVLLAGICRSSNSSQVKASGECDITKYIPLTYSKHDPYYTGSNYRCSNRVYYNTSSPTFYKSSMIFPLDEFIFVLFKYAKLIEVLSYLVNFVSKNEKVGASTPPLTTPTSNII